MADDSEKPYEILDFQPCAAPRGMLFYKLADLTADQQIKLNNFKINVMKENQRYLNFHPEIKALVMLLIKAVLKARPKVRIHTFLAKYLNEHWHEVKEMMETFEKQRELAKSKFEAYKGEVLEEEKLSTTESTVSSEITEEELAREEQEHLDIQKMCKEIIAETIEQLPLREQEIVDELGTEEEFEDGETSGSEAILIFPDEASYLSDVSVDESEELRLHALI